MTRIEDEARAAAEDALAFYDTYRVMSSAIACVEALRTLLAASRREPEIPAALTLEWAQDYARKYWTFGQEPESQRALTILLRASRREPSEPSANVSNRPKDDISSGEMSVSEPSDTDEREWEYADLYDSKGYHVAMQRRTKATDAAPAGEWEVFPDAV